MRNVQWHTELLAPFVKMSKDYNDILSSNIQTLHLQHIQHRGFKRF